MIIRKEFKFEMAHIVRNAYSTRCAKNIHGHSYRVEVFLDGYREDKAGMLVDFGQVKNLIGGFLDIFDHSTMLHNLKMDKETCEFFYKNFDRVIITPFPTTAEVQAKFMFTVINIVLEEWKKEENITDVSLKSIRVHETRTGYAECDINDIPLSEICKFDLKEKPNIMGEQIVLSEGLKTDEAWLQYYTNYTNKYV